MRARQYPAAVQAYQAAAQADPNHAPTFAALGAAQMAARNPAGAAQALRRATQLAPRNDSYFVGLARALVQNRQNAEAITALQAAVNINYDNMEAREGLRALGGEVPDPPLPEHPARDQIIASMRPLKAGLAGCAPMFGGRVVFRVAIQGETGNVTAASLEDVSGGDIDDDTKACMESVIQSARFPRFTRESFEISYPYQIEAPE
jgi:tetratricopeptide (TPR) repeat protein